MKRGGIKIIAVSGAGVAAISVAAVADFAPIVVWNASASAPIGLYRIERNSPPYIGDFVLVKPDEDLAKFVTKRGYLPENIPLLKRVAALSGDEICREWEAIFINETRVADALNFDSQGRIMPSWSGCIRLQSGEIFLLNDAENSFDGRYFGATGVDNVIGVARAVWVRG